MSALPEAPTPLPKSKLQELISKQQPFFVCVADMSKENGLTTTENFKRRALASCGPIMKSLFEGYMPIEVHNDQTNIRDQDNTNLPVGWHLFPTDTSFNAIEVHNVEGGRNLANLWHTSSPSDLYHTLYNRYLYDQAIQYLVKKGLSENIVDSVRRNISQIADSVSALGKADPSEPFDYIRFMKERNFMKKELDEFPFDTLPPTIPKHLHAFLNSLSSNSVSSSLPLLGLDEYSGTFTFCSLKDGKLSQEKSATSGARLGKYYLAPPDLIKSAVSKGKYLEVATQIDFEDGHVLTDGQSPIMEAELQAYLCD